MDPCAVEGRRGRQLSSSGLIGHLKPLLWSEGLGSTEQGKGVRRGPSLLPGVLTRGHFIVYKRPLYWFCRKASIHTLLIFVLN